MMTIFQNGGFPMYFILAFGLAALGAGIGFAITPAPEKEGFVRRMGGATLLAVGFGTCADLAAVARYVGTHELDGHKLGQILVEGIGESMSPSILGFALLSLVALTTAIGKRRLAARVPAAA